MTRERYKNSRINDLKWKWEISPERAFYIVFQKYINEKVTINAHGK